MMLANHHNPYIQGNESYAQILGQLAHGAETHPTSSHLQQQPIHPSLLPQSSASAAAAAAGLQNGNGHMNAGVMNQQMAHHGLSGNIRSSNAAQSSLTSPTSAPFNQPLLSPALAQNGRSPVLDPPPQPLGLPGNDALAPPIEGVFESRQELLDYVRQHALAHGYIATIHHSSRDRQVTLGCDLGGSYRPHSSHSALPTTSRRRKTSSKLQGCPFKVYGHREKTGEWTLRIQDATHNHPPPTDLNRHPMARRLSDESTTYALELLSQGVKPRDVLAAIKQRDPHTRALQKDIYNMKQKLKQANGQISGVDTSDLPAMDAMDATGLTSSSFADTSNFDPSLQSVSEPFPLSNPGNPNTLSTNGSTPSRPTAPSLLALTPEDQAAAREQSLAAKIKQLESTVTILRGEAAMVNPLKQRVRDLLEELRATEDDKQALMELRQSPAMQRLLARGGSSAAGPGAGVAPAFAGLLGPGGAAAGAAGAGLPRPRMGGQRAVGGTGERVRMSAAARAEAAAEVGMDDMARA